MKILAVDLLFGRSGILLMNIIKQIGYTREELYITNIVKCRPPGNRNPNIEESINCLDHLIKQINIVQPTVIVLLGAVALNILFNITGITRKRGIWLKYKNIKVMPTLHPSYLLRFPTQVKYVHQDFQKVKNEII